MLRRGEIARECQAARGLGQMITEMFDKESEGNLAILAL